ncbi:hypothetical protein RDABS01_000749 [Bienertia sinuspersici]
MDMSKCRHVSLAITKSIDQAIVKTFEGIRSELRTFLLIRDYGDSLKQIPSTFFKAHQFMQALDLSGSHISELPCSIGNMTQLRFLDLSFTLIESIPESIGHLGELQTLRLKKCECLDMLPYGIKQLTRLRHLYFDVLGQLTYLPEGIGSLTELRTLSAFIVSEEDGCSLRDLKNLNNLSGRFCISGLENASSEDAKAAAMHSKKLLTRLHLKWNGSNSYDDSARDNASSTLENLIPHTSLEELQISYHPSSTFPKWVHSEGFQKLVEVTLFRCKYMNFIGLESLSCLEHLNITDMDEVAKIDHANYSLSEDKIKFPNLNTLLIDGMLNLEIWTGIRFGDCPRLWKLSVKHCPKLTQLDFLPLLQSLTHLEISYCNSFKSLHRTYKDQLRLLCSLFPGDFEFEKNKLVQLWMAMGLLQEPLERVGNELFDLLLEEEFIIHLDGTVEYKINVEKVSSFSNGVESKDLYALIDDENTGMDLYKCRHLALAVNENIVQELFEKLVRFTELRMILLICDYGPSLKTIPSWFFTNLPLMQALDLSGSHISSLPDSIGDMTQLHFLDLSFTKIRRIPETIHHLGKLQTLKLRGCNYLSSLPTRMKQLASLRHLDFDQCGQLNCMPQEMGLLTELRTLSGFIVSQEDGCSLRELKNLNNLCGSFHISGLEFASHHDASEAAIQEKKQLTELQLEWKDSISYDDPAVNEAFSTVEDLRPHTSLKALLISRYPGKMLPNWMEDASFGQLVTITLFDCHNLYFSAPCRLPNLVFLDIIDMNGAEAITCNQYTGIKFPNLKALVIDRMDNLQIWTGIKDGDCPCLLELSVKHCPKLSQLDFLPLLHSLQRLELFDCNSFQFTDKLPASLHTLVINDCASLKKTYNEKETVWEKIKHVPYILVDKERISTACQDKDDTGNT